MNGFIVGYYAVIDASASRMIRLHRALSGPWVRGHRAPKAEVSETLNVFLIHRKTNCYLLLTINYPYWIINCQGLVIEFAIKALKPGYLGNLPKTGAAAMKTIFGKELVKIRLDNGISLKDMAAGLKVPSSYLSAVESASETNHKKLTSEFLDRIFAFLSLNETEELRLRKAAAVSTGECRIDTSSLDEKQLDTLTMFAQRVGALPDGEIDRIREILKSR